METQEIYKDFVKGSSNIISMSLLLTDETINISEKVNIVSMRRLGKSVKTIYVLYVSLPLDLMYKMEKDTNWKIQLKIYSKDSTNYIITEESDVPRTLQRDLMLQPFNNNSLIEAIDASVEKKILDGESVNSNEMSRLSLECFEYNAFFTDINLVNACYKDVIVEDVIYDLIKKSKITYDSINITKITNKKVYEQIFIPPMSIFDAIKYIIEFFSLHVNGTELFYDNKTLNIIERGIVITKKDDKLCFLNVNFANDLLEESSVDKFSSSAIKEIKYGSPVNVNNNVDVNLKNGGSKVIIFNSTLQSFSDKIEIDLSEGLEDFINKKQHIKEIYVANKYTNKLYAIENYKYDKRKDSITVQLSIPNLPISYVDVGTTFYLQFNTQAQQKYNGVFFIKTLTYDLTRADDNIQSLVTVELYKGVY